MCTHKHVAIFLHNECDLYSLIGQIARRTTGADLGVMQMHLELLEVEPSFGLVGIEIVEEVAREKPERVKFQVRREKNGRRRFLIDHT